MTQRKIYFFLNERLFSDSPQSLFFFFFLLLILHISSVAQETERELLPHWRSALHAKSSGKRNLHGCVIFSTYNKTVKHSHSFNLEIRMPLFCCSGSGFLPLAPWSDVQRPMAMTWPLAASPLHSSWSWVIRLLISRAFFHLWRKGLNLS